MSDMLCRITDEIVFSPWDEEESPEEKARKRDEYFADDWKYDFEVKE